MDGCASCISLQPRVRIEATILGATDSPRIALASIFASKNHVDVTSGRMTIDKTRNLHEINVEVIFKYLLVGLFEVTKS